MKQHKSMARRLADASLAALVLLMVGMMIIPLPTWLLDILLAANISIAVLMLLVAMYISSGLEFAAFPTVLLVTTLYRLALNVSSTRLILLQADAGKVIDAFGNFVVQGNYVVGAVVFLILTLIQFLVIAKGSERVAEVGARFTLDAMPGKQMSIDAELRSGAIGHEEAKQKRSHLARESQFYGAMDGAMKFVKGDAIAGIVITVINIIGGLAIGVAMRDMSAGDALKTYGLLTIGDGLVSQIPALLISTSAGLVVTRVAAETEDASLGSEVARQIFGNPRALAIAAAFLFVLAAIPGLPGVPFSVLGVVFGMVALRITQDGKATPLSATDREAQREEQARKELVPIVVPVAVELGSALADQIHNTQGTGALAEHEVPALRERLFLELGITLPGARVRVAPHLDPWSYTILVQEVPVASGTVPQGMTLAMATAVEVAKFGVQGEPAPELDGGTWVPAQAQPTLQAQGVVVHDTAGAVAQGMRTAIAQHAQSLLGLQEVQTMLDQLERAYPAVVRNVVPKPVSLPLLTDILRRLVEEGVSIRPMREILEALALYAATEKDPVQLTELVRASMRRQITHRHARNGVLSVFMLDPSIEETIRDAIQHTTTGSFLALQPDLARELVARIRQTCTRDDGTEPLLLTQADIRRFLRRLIEVDLPSAVVLSYQELAPEVTVQPVGRVQM